MNRFKREQLTSGIKSGGASADIQTEAEAATEMKLLLGPSLSMMLYASV